MGTVVRKTGRLSHRALEICCCRMVNDSVFGGIEVRTYTQPRRQFTFFLGRVMFEYRRELLPVFSQLPLQKTTESEYDIPIGYLTSILPQISIPPFHYHINIGPSLANENLELIINLVQLD